MKVTKLTLLAAVLASGLGLATAGFADQVADAKACPHKAMDHRFGPGDEPRAMSHMFKTLDLTDAQKATLKAQREAEIKNRDQLQDKLQAARDSLQKAVESGASDSELKSLSSKLGQVESERALAMAKSQKAFLAVLTPEQKQRLASLKAEREEKMKERMDKHHPARDTSES